MNEFVAFAKKWPLTHRWFEGFRRVNWKTVGVHIACWTLNALYEGGLIVNWMSGNSLSLGYYMMYYSIFAGLFYVNAYYLLPTFYAEHRYNAYLIRLLLCFLSVLVIKYFFQFIVLPQMGVQVNQYTHSLLQYVVLNLYSSIQYVIYSFCLWFAQHTIRLQQEKEKLKRDILTANLTNLRLQINPHFLYNMLNFFYGRVLPLSRPVAEGITLLSDMMRYALKEEGLAQKVPLTDEIRHISNFVQIQQLRYDNHLSVDLQVSGDPTGKEIVPLALITFVENVFKHGELHDPNDPAQIYVEIVKNRLMLNTYNRHRNGPKDPSTGIGVENTRNRLRAVYRENVQIEINEDENHYNCTLMIQLN